MPLSPDLDNSVPTVIAFVLDESGSMQGKQKGTVNGFNEYIQDLKKNENVYFSLTKFSRRGNITVAYPLQSVKNVPELIVGENYKPDGGTALLDATMKTIQNIEQSSQTLNLSTPPRFLVILFTDGEENDSVEYTFKQLKEEIAAKEETGNWTFVYLGESIEQWDDAEKIGISSVDTYSTTFRAANVGINSANLDDVYLHTMRDVSANSRLYMKSSVRSASKMDGYNGFMNLTETQPKETLNQTKKENENTKPDEQK